MQIFSRLSKGNLRVAVYFVKWGKNTVKWPGTNFGPLCPHCRNHVHVHISYELFHVSSVVGCITQRFA